MLILLSKLYLILDQDDVQENSNNYCHKNFMVFDLRSESNEPSQIVEWPITLSNNDEKPDRKNPISFTCGTTSSLSSPSFSRDNLLVLSDDQKNVVVFDSNFNKINQFKIKRNATKMILTKNGNKILICDKAGDIYEYKTRRKSLENVPDGDDDDDDGQLLLGHCSLILDFIMTPQEDYIISADRDEKIRVTHYPNTHSICSYCLGHKEFVSAIKLINDKFLVSGSGDGNLIVWDFKKGKNVFKFGCELENFSDNCEKRQSDNGDNDKDDVTSVDVKSSVSSMEKNEPNGNEETQASNKTEEKRNDFAIKAICIDNRKNDGHYLALSFFTKPSIYLFKIDLTIDTDGNFSSLLQLTHKLDFNKIPISIDFDLNHINFLWIFGSNQSIDLFELKNDQLIKPLITFSFIDKLNENENLRKSIEKYKEMENDFLSSNLFKHFYIENPIDCSYYQPKKSRTESTTTT